MSERRPLAVEASALSFQALNEAGASALDVLIANLEAEQREARRRRHVGAEPDRQYARGYTRGLRDAIHHANQLRGKLRANVLAPTLAPDATSDEPAVAPPDPAPSDAASSGGVQDA